MRNILTILSVLVCFIFTIIACSKKSGSLIVPDEIRYTYNGQQYTSSTPGCIRSQAVGMQNGLFVKGFYGLEIDNQAILGGKIVLTGINSGPWDCAYLEPTGSSVVPVLGNCQNLQTFGGSIDSVKVYLYESGSLQITSNACTSGTGYCKITGTFDVTLINKNSHRIRLTNGSFTGTY